MKSVFSFLVFASALVFSQKKYPQDYFRPPLDIPMQLSGNFGELRPNHFHTGFDFKTNQIEGLPVYAAADGYVSRIKIATNGYGKAIYITHPNGYTTVYGHLQKAVGILQEKIFELQYTAKNYEVESYFKPDELPVKKGELIALSGNTGGSEGPHLHFEIRDSKTEKIINPLFFGIPIPDIKSPTVSNLFVYPISQDAVVNESKRPVILSLSLQKDGTYLAEKVYAKGNIGFGINAGDMDDVSYNINGVYKTQLYSNGQPVFGYEFDQMDFDEARYVNAFIDYARYKKTHQRIQKLFMKQPYAWSNVTQNGTNGILDITPNLLETARIEVSDYNENKVILNIPIVYSNTPAKIEEETKPTPYFVKSKVDALFEKDKVSVFFPAGTFYEDFYLNFKVEKGTLHLHEDIVPAHSNFAITFENDSIPNEERKKFFIASINGKKIGFNATKYTPTAFTCKSKTLGMFRLVKDTLAPKIIPPKHLDHKWISDKTSLQFTITDELSGIKTYNGYLNDKWVLFEYESKTDKITHVFDEKFLLEGENKLKIEVTDNVGNSTIFETQFYRSQKK
ncbi:M23 family metallopeptidase [Flavobacterium aciduliphilum]|nr:M23 family metallopeptidase [Flavobacterium aciduliphilum]